MAVDRSALKAQLRERGKESYNRREAFSDNSVGIWVTGAVTVLASSQFAEQAHFIDVIPFVAGRYWPSRLNFGGQGQWAPYMELFVHQNVGPMKGQYPCPAANWGESCPICEHQNKLRNEWTDPSDEQKDILKGMYPKRRCIYNVRWVNDAKTESMGVMALDMAHFTLQRHLETLVVGRSGEPEIFYADPDEGKTIQFTRQGKGLTTQYIGVQFVDRDYQISDEELDMAYTLDEMLNLPKDDAGNVLWGDFYKTIKKAFFATEDDDQEVDQVLPPPQQQVVQESQRTRRNPPMATQDTQASTQVGTQNAQEDGYVDQTYVANQAAEDAMYEANQVAVGEVRNQENATANTVSGDAPPLQSRRRAVQPAEGQPKQSGGGSPTNNTPPPAQEQTIRSRRRAV